ncbi:MAG: Rad52/Rad22 family DNA repair protein [Bacteroidota bacterium]
MAVTPHDLRRLSAPFPANDIEWKPGATTRDRKKGLAMAYLTSRAIQDRLDDVCGPGNWRNAFEQGPGGGVLCGLAVLVARDDGTTEWVTKWDGAENTEFESVKGGLSSALKRAAVQWGIGRYLYSMPALWVPLDERGRFAEKPRIPAKFLPARGSSPARDSSEEGHSPVRPAPSGPPEAARSGGASPPRTSNTRVIRKAGNGESTRADRNGAARGRR